MYCVYLHRRKNDGVVYYVGCGSRVRPYDFINRSEAWESVHASAGTTVEIVRDSLSHEEAKEIEGRIIAALRPTGNLVNVQDKTTKQQEVREFYETFGRFPSQHRTNEKKLWSRLCGYCTPIQHTYDPDFHAWAKERGYGQFKGIEQDSGSKKTAIKEFHADRSRLPSQCRREERRMASWLHSYCSPGSDCYDESFRMWAESVGYGTRKGIGQDPRRKKEEILKFREERGRFPSTRREDERALAWCLGKYVRKETSSYDPVFHRKVVALGYGSKPADVENS